MNTIDKVANAGAQQHEHTLGDDTIQVIDGLFSPDERQNVFRVLAGLTYFRRQGDFAGDTYLRLAAAIDLEDLDAHAAFAFYHRIAGTIARCVPPARYAIFSAYVNQIAYGDASFPHRDCPRAAGDMTVLYYANEVWEESWGGHTLLFDAVSPFHVAVLPIPGRLLVFPGHVEHCAGVPGRACRQSRYTLALKYARREGDDAARH